MNYTKKKYSYLLYEFTVCGKIKNRWWFLHIYTCEYLKRFFYKKIVAYTEKIVTYTIHFLVLNIKMKNGILRYSLSFNCRYGTFWI